MRDRYEAGASTQELADEYGVTNATVWRTIRANGGEMRGRNPGVRKGKEVVAERGAEIARDYLAGDMLHRIVMARTIKRPLDPAETVHHIDGDRLNNSIENLQLRTGRHGSGVHFRCHDCGSQNVGPVEL